MDVVVRGRHTRVAERFRDYADEKLDKIQKFDPKLAQVYVEVSKEPGAKVSGQRERVELTCYSRGPAIRAEAAAADRYSALDQALSKLKERLRKASDRRKVHRGNHTPRSTAEATAPAAVAMDGSTSDRDLGRGSPEETDTSTSIDTGSDSYADSEDQSGVPLDTEGATPVVVREKVHRSKPMALDQALFEMELVGHDFYLFFDSHTRQPSVVYRRKGFDYGVIRLEE